MGGMTGFPSKFGITFAPSSKQSLNHADNKLIITGSLYLAPHFWKFGQHGGADFVEVHFLACPGCS